MNCSTFKKKLFDYIEDNVQYDMKKAMEDHIHECEDCKSLYAEEKRMDDIFKNAFDLEGIKFNSSRAAIMKNIDKNKYSGSCVSKVRFHIKKYQLKYLSYAAILTIILISSPLIAKMTKDTGLPFGSLKRENIAMDNSTQSKAELSSENGKESYNIATNEEQLKIADNADSEDSKSMSAAELNEPIYIPKFRKAQTEKEPEKDMATQPKFSLNRKLQARLDGRGISAADEGVADIFIANESGDKWRLQLIDNIVGDKTYTPMYLEWMDNENLLVTLGEYAYGHATLGGSVYMVNVNAGKSYLVYEVDSSKEQVAVIERMENSIKLIVKVFIDEMKNKTRDEERILNFTTITDKTLEPISSLYAYVTAINNKRMTDALDKLTSESKKDYISQVGDIKNINSINIMKVIDVTSDYTIDEELKVYSEAKVYYIQAEYNMNNPTIKAQGNETLYQKVVMIKEKSNSPWQIESIQIINQSSAN